MATILVIDDSATMLKSMQMSLQINGHQVETASDGAQAMARLRSGFRPDLIITDINMPNMGGIEFIRAARQLLRFTPILALTTEGQKERRDEAKKLGATGWMLKPVGGTEMMKVVAQILQKAA